MSSSHSENTMSSQVRPLVSVIIPAFNAKRFLPESIASIFNQTYPRYEVILVDDGSTDGTGEWLREAYPKVRYLKQANSGACSAPRNAGARIAEGSLLAFFDADDVMLPHHLVNHVDMLSGASNALISISNYQNFSHESGANIGVPHFESCGQLLDVCQFEPDRRAAVISGTVARRILACENFSIASGLMVRRNEFDRLGGFDESLSASEDFDLVFRASRLGDLGVVSSVGFMRRIHGANMSFQGARIIGEKIRSRQKLYVAETDSITRSRLRTMLVELQIDKALNSRAFNRAQRMRAIIEALRLRPVVKKSHIIALLKLLF